MKIGIVGNGVVGAATGRAFSAKHQVYAHDSDPLKSGWGVQQLLDLCDIIFVCLPTPRKTGGMQCDTSILDSFFRSVAGSSETFVLRSTVPVGYARHAHSNWVKNLIYTPEFLTERTADFDACNPARMLVGTSMRRRGAIFVDALQTGAAMAVANLYSTTFPDTPVYGMAYEEAEAVKMFQNAFSAVKVAMFNELRTFAD